MSNFKNNSQTVLITGFKPFAGRPINGSETLARSFEGEEIAGHQVIVKSIDVAWGAPEQFLPEWQAEYSPSAVVGLGEGSGAVLRLESVGFNRAEGIDESGNEPPHAPCLDPEGPQSRQSTLQFSPKDNGTSAPWEFSEDAGTFLCNNWLYTALDLFSVPTGFIHLPIQGDSPGSDYVNSLKPLLTDIIAANLPQL